MNGRIWIMESDLRLEVVPTRAQAVARAQACWVKYAVPGRLISEELVAERREEARLEDEDP
jgi:hypothetical protein